ncbi:rhomboid family intramembrane serine protease [Frigidibacter sp. SD6-1]|uniref:rhomboid family intramembrane serine protease n=1 Tax=Frigidibacter sp. SD6-1 TaxID=3032581 RepID=UPI0024DF5DE2|nr:rhomboid family intramembrane serine protease [Frigidibacter sp. SD6-1]
MQDYQEPPFNPVPPVVWAVLLPIIAVEVVLSLGASGLAGGPQAIGWRQWALQTFALSPQMLDEMIARGSWTSDYVKRLVTYLFFHASFVHALFVAIFTLALGKMVAEVFRPWAFLAIFFGAGIAGALVYSVVPGLEVWLIGGYPAAYGLIGAFTFLIWARLRSTGDNSARAFMLIGTLLGLQLLFGMLFGGAPDWIADLAGFAAGFGLSFLLVPGGPQQVLARLRRR